MNLGDLLSWLTWIIFTRRQPQDARISEWFEPRRSADPAASPPPSFTDYRSDR